MCFVNAAMLKSPSVLPSGLNNGVLNFRAWRNRPAERQSRDLDLPLVRYPPNDRVDSYQEPR